MWNAVGYSLLLLIPAVGVLFLVALVSISCAWREGGWWDRNRDRREANLG